MERPGRPAAPTCPQRGHRHMRLQGTRTASVHLLIGGSRLRPGSPLTGSRTSTASSPITVRATARPTSLESSATARDTRRPGPTRPDTTGRWSATSESWPRNCYTPESSRAKKPATPRSKSGISTTTTTAPTVERADIPQHLGSVLASPTSGPHTARDLAVQRADESLEPAARAGANWIRLHHNANTGREVDESGVPFRDSRADVHCCASIIIVAARSSPFELR